MLCLLSLLLLLWLWKWFVFVKVQVGRLWPIIFVGHCDKGLINTAALTVCAPSVVCRYDKAKKHTRKWTGVGYEYSVILFFLWVPGQRKCEQNALGGRWGVVNSNRKGQVCFAQSTVTGLLKA